MPLEIREISSAKEIPEVIACLLESFAEPEISFYDFVAPAHGTTEVARNDRVLIFSAREWFDHSSDPTSNWLKIVDTDNGDRVAASMRWNVYEKDPFLHGIPELNAFWQPEGPTRRFTEGVLGKLLELRIRRMPHLFIRVTHTHPSYRRRGAGRMLMEWGIKKADELGLECFVEASPQGSALYEQYGFRSYTAVNLRPEPLLDEGKGSEEWKRCCEALGSLGCAAMRRPVRGEWSAVAKEEADRCRPKGSLETNLWKVEELE